jgi:hypothetical protein
MLARGECLAGIAIDAVLRAVLQGAFFGHL